MSLIKKMISVLFVLSNMKACQYIEELLLYEYSLNTLKQLIPEDYSNFVYNRYVGPSVKQEQKLEQKELEQKKKLEKIPKQQLELNQTLELDRIKEKVEDAFKLCKLEFKRFEKFI